MFKRINNGLLFSFRGETLSLVAHGCNAIRVRCTKNAEFQNRDWALDLPVQDTSPLVEICDSSASLTNGKLRAQINAFGKLCFYNQAGKILLREYYRTGDLGCDFADKDHFDDLIMIHTYARQYRAMGSSYHITARFDADDGERLYGMGQYQHPYLNLKGCVLELAQYNTQASVPFLVSDKGYGLLWNNPGIGRAEFGKNITQWEMESTQQLDYWIVAGDTPAEIVENYAAVTGRVPMMPDCGLGFWQCKLRYRTQAEVMQVAREYQRRHLPLEVIVIDFFHWTNQGEWKFDPAYWPDPKGMVEELNRMGTEVMVSVWPTVDRRSENFAEMRDRDLLIRVERGTKYAMDLFGSQNFVDFTNPEAQAYLWEKCKAHYFDQGISLFWLDVAEPEYTAADFDIYRYHMGPASECANIYPALYAKTFYDGLKAQGVENPVSLIRCAWAGSQRYGALAWSGDVPSSFTYLRNQITAGLNMGMAGIPWWTADIGGFHGASIEDPDFLELLIRWFEYGTFCPVMRLHGDRDPHSEPLSKELGGGMCASGADNEIWSYGAEQEAIMTRYINARHAMKPYIKQAMQAAHLSGTPIIKPLFYCFSQDAKAWEVEDEYLFGEELLVAPVYQAGVRSRTVYLPQGARWQNVWTNVWYEGGQTVEAEAPLHVIPLFAKSSEIKEMLACLQ